jgi:hypothetical protein
MREPVGRVELQKNGESISRYGSVSSPKTLAFQRLPDDGVRSFWHYIA